MKRVFLAVLVAPIASPLLITLQFGDFDWRLVAATLTVAYVALAVVALPLFYLFYRLGWRRWWHFLIAGVVACCLFMVYDLIEAPPSRLRLDHLLPWAWRFIVHAMAASLVFWAVGIRPRAHPAPSTTETS